MQEFVTCGQTAARCCAADTVPEDSRQTHAIKNRDLKDTAKPADRAPVTANHRSERTREPDSGAEIKRRPASPANRPAGSREFQKQINPARAAVPLGRGIAGKPDRPVSPRPQAGARAGIAPAQGKDPKIFGRKFLDRGNGTLGI
ncbi:hypothetical protein [Ruixingdingia sedimenti]|uniref:Uncharacterized protein n=1 Tax=Ruixingdingia sedimenti TaxID=3073604 RepID=A0ABU1FB63_9RHOB|nr:hypothetical protein [Xinfangfangia sp. LG-4]MDR5654110.1 hypothetical protein [Xinfangfangia sp. LG-4]